MIGTYTNESNAHVNYTQHDTVRVHYLHVHQWEEVNLKLYLTWHDEVSHAHVIWTTGIQCKQHSCTLLMKLMTLWRNISRTSLSRFPVRWSLNFDCMVWSSCLRKDINLPTRLSVWISWKRKEKKDITSTASTPDDVVLFCRRRQGEHLWLHCQHYFQTRIFIGKKEKKKSLYVVFFVLCFRVTEIMETPKLSM